MLGHHRRHHFDGAFVIKALTRADIQFVGNGVQLLLAMSGQISALGQVLADQTVNVLVTAALPRAMWVAEIDSYTRSLRNLGMTRHFSSLVVVNVFRAARGIRFKAALKPSTAEVAVASCIFTSIR